MCLWVFISARTCHRWPLSSLQVSNIGQCLCEHVSVAVLHHCCVILVCHWVNQSWLYFISDSWLAKDRIQMVRFVFSSVCGQWCSVLQRWMFSLWWTAPTALGKEDSNDPGTTCWSCVRLSMSAQARSDWIKSMSDWKVTKVD